MRAFSSPMVDGCCHLGQTVNQLITLSIVDDSCHHKLVHESPSGDDSIAFHSVLVQIGTSLQAWLVLASTSNKVLTSAVNKTCDSGLSASV